MCSFYSNSSVSSWLAAASHQRPESTAAMLSVLSHAVWGCPYNALITMGQR